MQHVLRFREGFAGAVKSKMVKVALKNVGSGGSHVTQAQEYMQAAVGDDVSLPAVTKFASLGADGAYCGNAWRDLSRWLKVGEHLECEPDTIKVTIRYRQRGKKKCSTKINLPVLGPHLLAHALYKAGPEQFSQCLLGPSGEEGLRDYWKQALSSCEWARLHPSVQQHEAELHRLIPLV